MQPAQATVVLGSTMAMLSVAQQLSFLFGAFCVKPKDDAQRRYFEKLIVDYFIAMLGGTCAGWRPGNNCGDKHGIPYHGAVPLEFHHNIPGSGLYYISCYRHANDPMKRLANINAFAAEVPKYTLLCKKHHKEWHELNRIRARI